MKNSTRSPEGDAMTSVTKQRMSAWALVLVYGILLFVQSSYPAPPQVSAFSGSDKLFHFGAYAFLGWLVMRAFRVSLDRLPPHTILFFSVSLTVLYGVSDEIHQLFVASRCADVMDILADGVGGSFGVYLYFLLFRGSFTGSDTPR